MWQKDKDSKLSWFWQLFLVYLLVEGVLAIAKYVFYISIP